MIAHALVRGSEVPVCCVFVTAPVVQARFTMLGAGGLVAVPHRAYHLDTPDYRTLAKWMMRAGAGA